LNYIYDDDALFLKRLHELIEKGYISINTDLINSLKNGLFVCDEIHNVYNVKEKNNRGIAIKYVLDYLEKEDPINAPRCLFMTATPLSGSPTEIVDLMNILIPNTNVHRDEFFNEEILKPNALEKISRLCTGYISFLKDTTAKSYPRKYIRGESINDIPYLTFVRCYMSKQHEQITRELFKNNVVPINASSMVDCLFPNPDCPPNKPCEKMLCSITDAKNKIETASKMWLNTIGIHNTTDTLTGEFLHIKNLAMYSAKYYKLMMDILNIIKKGDRGKILIYHKYVTGTGILFIKEILLRNGILDMTTEALSNTLCSICGVQLSEHTDKKTEHSFMPCRCLLVYGDAMIGNDVTLNAFGADDNIYGYKYKIMLGSKLVQEGVNFTGLRHLMVLSVPNDISSLVQIIGRAVRHKSHEQLPEELRDVNIGIYIHYSDNVVSPEQYQYKKKMTSYLSIQTIEKELRRNAVDCFINYDKIQNKTTASLDGLPYKPAVSFDKNADATHTTIVSIPKNINFSFFAYEFSDREVETIVVLIKKLFTVRPVWTYKDLWCNVRNPHYTLTPQYVTSYFLEGNFKIALQLLIDPAYVKYEKPITRNDYNVMFIRLGNSIRRIIKMKDYFILVPVDDNGCPILDHNIYMKSFDYEVYNTVSLSDKIMTKYTDEKIDELSKKIVSKYTKLTIDSILIKEPKYIHMYLIRNILTKKMSNDLLLSCYMKYGIIITLDDFNSNTILTKNISSTTPIGYVECDLVHLYMQDVWSKVNKTSLKQYPRKENDIIIGYIVDHNDEAVFKLKPPTAISSTETDMRKVFRGAVCDTFSLQYKYNIAHQLGIVKSIDDTKDRLIICDLLLENLFERELASRLSKTGERWLYLFNESPKI
jgi:hypothetical protein